MMRVSVGRGRLIIKPPSLLAVVIHFQTVRFFALNVTKTRVLMVAISKQ